MGITIFNRQDVSKQTRTFSHRFDVNEYLTQHLGEPFREYRKLFESAVRFETELPFPIHMDFETAFICNLSCVMCTHAADAPDSIKPKRPNFLDLELFKKIIDEGTQHTLRSIGLDQEGEPLINNRLAEYISYAKTKGILDIMLNSNATLLSKEKIEMLLHSGLTRIHFSIDAVTEAIYNTVRVGGNFETVVNNVLAFLKRKKDLKLPLPVTRVSFVKMKQNQHEVEDFVQFWQNKVDYIAIQEYNSPFPREEAYRHFIAETRDTNFDFHCTQPWFRMVVLSDGSIMPCCLLGYSKLLTVGNAYTDSVYDAWNLPRVKALRQIHKDGMYWKNPVCQMCASNFVPLEQLRQSAPDPIHLTFPSDERVEGLQVLVQAGVRRERQFVGPCKTDEGITGVNLRQAIKKIPCSVPIYRGAKRIYLFACSQIGFTPRREGLVSREYWESRAVDGWDYDRNEDETYHRAIGEALLELQGLEWASLLEIGCGFGRVLHRLRAAFPERVLVGGDFSFQQLLHSNAYLSGQGIGLIQFDARYLPFYDKQFDVILTCDALMYLHPGDLSAVMRELKRVGRRYLVLLERDREHMNTPLRKRLMREAPWYGHNYARELQRAGIPTSKAYVARAWADQPERVPQSLIIGSLVD